MRVSSFFLLLLLSAVSLFAERIVFQIGKPDASGAEFKHFRGLDDTRFRYMNGYDEPHRPYRNLDKSIEFFQNPIVFKVGKSKDSDWPFIHPVGFCEWSNEPENTKDYFIEFSTPNKPEDYYLHIGFADSSESWFSIRIQLNGKQIGYKDGLYYSRETKRHEGAPVSLYAHPEGKGFPSDPFTIKIPHSSFKADGSKNVIKITCNFNRKHRTQHWFVYDFLKLTNSPEYPKIADPRPELLERAIKAMGTEEVIICTRGEGRDYHWYANFGKLVHAKTGSANVDYCFNQEVFSRKGGKLFIYNLRTGKYKLLIDDPEGCVRDAQLSYDAKKVLFSYRKGTSDTFHIYEIDIDGKNLTKLPMATDANDIEPCYMPNGDILYTSDRLNRTVQCWMVPVSNLHRWFRAENKIRFISTNPDVDNRPRILNDGRIIYMRWDYNHRSQISYHHLWTINPDGSNDMVYLGNDKPGGLFIGAEQLPDSEGVVFTKAPGHGIKDHRGAIAYAKPPFDPSDPYAFTYVNGLKSKYRYSLFDPYPLKDGIVLATSHSGNIMIYDEHGLFYEIPLPEELLASKHQVFMNLPKMRGNKPRNIPECKIIARNIQPVTPRKKESVRVDMADFSKNTAQVFLQDIYQGRKMADVKRGSIKKLMITQVLAEPVHYHGGYSPLNYNGGFALEKIWGTVPVYEDGSAKFEVPSQKPLAFLALDEDGRVVKRMQSFSGFAPGTTTSCVGCHENRTEAPIRKKALPMAYRKPVSKLEKIKGVPPIIDYMRHVQPILDKHCVSCHNPRNAKGGVILTGGITSRSIMSLATLRCRDQIITGSNKWGNMKPYTFGSGGSKLMSKIDGSHKCKRLPEEEYNLIKAWLDTGAFQIGTYAAVGTGFLFDAFFETGYSYTNAENPKLKAVNEVVSHMCSKCHWNAKTKRFGLAHVPWIEWNAKIHYNDSKGNKKNSKMIKSYLYDFLNPDDSLVLLTPLAKEAGGLADGTKKTHPVIFKDKKHPEFQKLDKNFREFVAQLRKDRPFQHEKHFRPTYGYMEMMKKCGIIPKDFPEDKPVDAMEIDEKYFKWQEDNVEYDLVKKQPVKK